MSKETRTVKQYDESKIKHYDGLRAVREKPTIYIGSLGAEGTYHLFKEGFGNVIDEFSSGRCKNMWVFIDNKHHVIEIRDDACGIPIGEFENICTKMFTGGKYDKSDNGAYDFSLGTNGCGVKLINALSEKLIVETYREGKRAYGEFSKGETLKLEITDAPNTPSGTTIRFVPDITVLLDININYSKYADTLEMLSYIHSGFTIYLTIENRKPLVYYHPNGMSEYTEKFIKDNKSRPVSPTIFFTGSTRLDEETVFEIPDGNGGIRTEKRKKTVDLEFDTYFTWGENVKCETIESFVNGLRTVSHGTHVSGFRAALTAAIKRYITKNELLPKNSKLEIDGNDVRDTVIGTVIARLSDPIYETQTKQSLTNDDIMNFIKTQVYNQLSTWLENNSKISCEICKLVIRSAKMKQAAKAAKENIIKSGGKITLISVNPLKFTDCKSKDPTRCELFIVEGDSAGGSAKDARDTETQAVFRVRGKIQNTFKSKNTVLSEELVMLAEVLGCGIGANFDIRKLRYHKIIKGADADSDGSHISTLIDGFFFTNYIDIIKAGYLYEATPPLYQLTIGKGQNAKDVYIPNARYFQKAISVIATNAFMFTTLEGIVLSDSLAGLYISKLEGFKQFIESYSVPINLDPELLEFIIANYTDVVNKNFSALASLGYECDISFENESSIHLTINRDYESYCLILDSRFYHKVYVPLYKRMSDIRLYNVRFVSKRSGTKYGGSMYRNACFLDNLLIGKNVHVRRTKGLGESSPQELRYYMFNPSTRSINKIKLEDAEKAAKELDILLGKNIEGKKDMLSGDIDISLIGN